MVTWSRWATGRTHASKSSTEMASPCGNGDLGIPLALSSTPDHFLYTGDAIAGRILKIDPQGRVLGSFT
jgi:hypothetical protein